MSLRILIHHLLFFLPAVVAFIFLVRRIFYRNKEVRKKISQLSALNKAGRVLNSSLSLKTLFNLVISISASLMGVESAFLFFLNKKTGKLERENKVSSVDDPCYEIASYVMGKKTSLLLNKGDTDSMLTSIFKKNKNLNSIICVPLITKDKLWGVLGVESSFNFFNEADLELLSTFANEAAVSIENRILIEDLLRFQKLDSFNRTSSIVAHDLRNSISRLSFLIQNAKINYKDPEFQKDLIETLSYTIERMENLVEKLSGSPSLLALRIDSINEVIHQAIKDLNLYKEKKIKLKENYADVSNLMIDKENMRRVFVNLLQNARESISEEGEISILTREEKKSREVFVEISDTGCGMNKEFIKQSLFNPFVTTKEKGLGLGLFSSREIVSLHGGRIEVESKLGQGTKFTVILPVPPGKKRAEVISKLIGEYLLEMGVINSSQLQKAVEIQIKDKRRLGEILINLGYIRKEHLSMALRKQKEMEERLK